MSIVMSIVASKQGHFFASRSNRRVHESAEKLYVLTSISASNSHRARCDNQMQTSRTKDATLAEVIPYNLRTARKTDRRFCRARVYHPRPSGRRKETAAGREREKPRDRDRARVKGRRGREARRKHEGLWKLPSRLPVTTLARTRTEWPVNPLKRCALAPRYIRAPLTRRFYSPRVFARTRQRARINCTSQWRKG